MSESSQELGTICIIGAGAAGLAALKAVLDSPRYRAGLWMPTAFESRNEVGGIWLPDTSAEGTIQETLPKTPLYDSLTTNLPHPVMAYPSFPFPPSTPVFPGAAHVQSYLKSYAAHFDLGSHIRFNTTVTDVLRSKSGWSVSLDTGEMLQFDLIIVANGHYAIPRYPDVPGLNDWLAAKKAMHSIWFRRPERFGNEVLVVGGGPSGNDISADLATVCPEIVRSVSGATVSDSGSIKTRGRTTRFGPDGKVFFEDGSVENDIDFCILATGYEVHFPFLSEEIVHPTAPPPCPPLPDELYNSTYNIFPLAHHIWPLQKHFPPTTMAFLGLPVRVAPLPVMEAQAVAVLHAFEHPESLDLEAARTGVLDRYQAVGGRAFSVFQESHEQFDYSDALHAFSSSKVRAPIWRRTMYEEKTVLRRFWVHLERTGEAEAWVKHKSPCSVTMDFSAHFGDSTGLYSMSEADDFLYNQVPGPEENASSSSEEESSDGSSDGEGSGGEDFAGPVPLAEMQIEGPALSFEVKALLGDANQAYVDGDLSEAIRLMREVIRIEPRAASAWSVLAQCHDDLGKPEEALQLRIMAAHLRHEGEEWDRLARQSNDLGFKQQALYCWGKLASLDPTNINAQWDRASLARDLGDLKTTRHAFLAILKVFPHDIPVLSELRNVLVELGDLETCLNLFAAAFEHYQRVYPTGAGDLPGGGFGLMELLVLADLYNTVSEHRPAVEVIRRGCRWLQGRGDQRYWDACDDDREYDLELFKRVVDEGPQPGFYPLDVNARHRLSVARIQMGYTQEAKFHTSAVLAEDVLDYAPLFAETADAYFDQKMYAEARPIYELLGTEESTSSMYILLRTAICLRMLNELRPAVDVHRPAVRLVDPTNNDAKLKLAEIYEILNEPRKALDLVYEVIDSRRRGNKIIDDDAGTANTAPPTSSLFAEESKSSARMKRSQPQNRMSREALIELETQMELETLRSHQHLQELYPQIDLGLQDPNEAERDWVITAERLLDAFRETRQLFTTTGQFKGMFPGRERPSKDREAMEARMISRLQMELDGGGSSAKNSTDVFRGLNFRDWLSLTFQYAFLSTKRNQYESAEDLLKHMALSIAFRSAECQTSIRLALISGRFSTVVEHARKIITTYQFNNEPLRILLAVLSSGLHPTDAFIVSPLQKFLYREMKLVGVASKNPELAKWTPAQKRFSLINNKGEDGDDEPADEAVPTAVGGDHVLPAYARKPNPVITAIYGQVCVAAKSYQSAIFYLLQAYEMCPEDPMICLSLTMASLGRAMQRQSDNRHHLVAQALAFLSRYRALRTEQTHGLGEIEYNFGRAFQQIGLHSHAARHYEAVLALAETQQDKTDTLAQEAAYNLAFVYNSTGAVELARALYRRWLTV
ncbi:unnamed protein product [Mycena citricolor]|uniref:TPR-like protein n=1 Tax=Mycena citricolor TaxID=2018698 RepID=A0AAD2K2X7_9AGAR|nr:unnamed protein product [Mycena citricolor]